VLAIPEWIDGEDLHVDRLSIHPLKALVDDNEVLLRASGLRWHPAGLVAHQGNGFAEAAMCVYVNGLDSLAFDHHWQALSAVLLSPRRIPQPTTAENDAGRGAGTLEKIPARVNVPLPVDHFDRTSRTAGRHP